MMDAHDWGTILGGAIPASAATIIAFTNMTSPWKWAILLLAMGAAYLIVSRKSKKKSDLFTALAVVFLSGLLTHFLQQAGFL